MSVPKIGDKAPEFKLVTVGENGPTIVTLTSLLEKKKSVVLLFVPFAFTGVCTKELCSTSGGIGEYEALDASVVGISGDSPFANAEWAKKENITLPLLSDYDHVATTAYGIAKTPFAEAANLIMGGVPKRSAFVIDAEGVVQHVEVLEDPHELPDLEKVKEVLKTLQKK